MPDVVAASSVDTGRSELSASKKAIASSSPSSSLLSKCDGPDVSNQKQHAPRSMTNQSQNSSQLKLKKPFSKKTRRMIRKKTLKLIKRRNALDRDVLIAAEKTKPSVSDWLSRDELLRDRERMKRREQYHLRKRTKKLAERERLYRWDPSAARAHDYDLIRKLLWRFKRNLGPLLDEYTNRPSQEDDGGDETSSSGSDSDLDSELESDAASSDDGGSSQGTLTTKPSSLRGRKGHKAAPHSQNKVTAEVSTSTPLGVQADGGKRKREEAFPKRTSSKKVKSVRDEEISDDMALKQDPENEALSCRDIPRNDGSSITTYTSEKRRLIEGRRRLDDIVGQGFDALDSLVFDLPDSPLSRYRRRRADNESPYYMSGALVVSSPAQAKSNTFAAGLADEVREDLVYPRPPFIELSVSSHGPAGHDSVTPCYYPHHNLKDMNGCHNKDQREKSSLSQIELDKHQSQVDQNQNRPTPELSNSYSRIWVPSGFLKGFLGQVRGKCNDSVQNSAQTSPQVQPSSSRRETPIPAPQPWKELGIMDPFRDETPIPAPQPWKELGIEDPFSSCSSRTAINKSPSQCHSVTNPSNTPINTSSPSKPHVSINEQAFKSDSTPPKRGSQSGFDGKGYKYGHQRRRIDTT
ncbi:hypothetical protein F5Y09DRAFT_338500 [Xylaria sp. FL1042]|nr:hypothetical protein F5Y09DRAFT_338500 [Xylaria sp. FL1042]